MRRLFPFLLLVLAFAAAFSQDAPAALSLSKSMIAIKISDPQRQIIAFQPLFSRIDDLIDTLKPGGGKVTDKLTKGLGDLAKVPGINVAGDFWITFTPSDKPAEAEEVKDQPPMPFNGIMLLVPLKDAELFKTFANSPEAAKKFPPCQIFDNYAVLQVFGKKPVKYSGVNCDISLISKRDVVVWVHLQSNPMAGMEKQAGEMAPFVSTLSGLIDDFIKNEQSAELGLAMTGDDLSLESYVTPVPDSPLAKDIAAQQPNAAQAVTLAGYLPENLAFCSASGPMLEGAPGLGNAALRVVMGLMTGFMEPEQGKALSKQFDQLSLQCKNGRAIGMTVPPANLQTSATLVAVYQVKDPQAAAAAMHGFVQEVMKAKDSFFNGGLSTIVKIFTKPNAEMTNAVPVDLIKIIIATGELGNDPAAKPITIEGRVAYTNDKMLLAIGDTSKDEITAMIGRIKDGTTGFTASKRFDKLKAGLPENIRGFESYAMLDMCKAGASLLPVDPTDKKDIIKFLSLFPQQKSVINSYGDFRDGRLHSDLRIPGEELDFVSTLIKGLAAFGDNNKGNTPAPKNGGTPPKKK